MSCNFFLFIFISIFLTLCDIAAAKGKPRASASGQDWHVSVRLVSWSDKYLDLVELSTDRGRTNLTCHLKQPCGNNVTVHTVYQSKGKPARNTSVQLCRWYDTWQWALNYTREHFELLGVGCPVPPGHYHYIDMQATPRYVPYMDPRAQFDHTLTLLHTTRRDTLLQVLIMNRQRRKKTNH